MSRGYVPNADNVEQLVDLPRELVGREVEIEEVAFEGHEDEKVTMVTVSIKRDMRGTAMDEIRAWEQQINDLIARGDGVEFAMIRVANEVDTARPPPCEDLKLVI